MSVEELLEEAPCGYVTATPDGTLLRVNRTFERWTGLTRDELLGGGVRFQDLLAPGDQIYHETHYAPMLRLHGQVREVAVELVRGDGSRLPALLSSVLTSDEEGQPSEVRTVVFEATDRRRYEEELLHARRREHETAQRLQRSLLAGELPHAPDLEIGVAYHPGVRGLEVGGDWYDAFWLVEGRTVALVVGDVVGRGIEAAATMGQLRSALRALATPRAEPAAVLAALDRFAHRHDVGQMATVVYAQLDLATRRLRFACAGHPPPVLVAPGGSAQLVWGGRSAPLDVMPSPGRTDHTVELEPATAVLLYTDGLVERRGEALDDGMRRLLAAAQGASSAAAPSLPADVVREMLERPPEDDVCVLAARVLAT